MALAAVRRLGRDLAASTRARATGVVCQAEVCSASSTEGVRSLDPATSVSPSWTTRRSRKLCESASASASASASQGGDEYDVVVVGGGMIGSALACGLKHGPLTSELRVAVVDKEKQQGWGAESRRGASVPDIRVSTLTPSTLGFLDRVGVGSNLLPPVSASFDSMQVWDAFGRGHMQFSSPTFLGQVIENEVLKEELQRRAEELGCDFVYGSVTDIAVPRPKVGITKAPEEKPGGDGDRSVISFASGLSISTPLVVGADGAQSLVAKKAGIRFLEYNYGQRAVTCALRVSEPHSTAFQRFLPTGPIALLPVRGGYSNVVWSTTVAEAKRLESLGSKEFARAVDDALRSEPASAGGDVPFFSPATLGSAVSTLLGGRRRTNDVGGDLGQVTETRGEFVDPPEVLEVAGTSQKSFPLGSKHALTYCQRGVVLVGDAAHRIHPLAGQGVNIGFGDVECLMIVLQEALWSGQDYSDLLTLEKYSRERRIANAAMIRTLDAVKSLYQSQYTPLALTRNLGMDILNNSGPLKDAIVGYASSNATAKKIF
ncbi:ubiquinone biosynthesis monooxygenase COQ6 [Chloropicon primus]|nr:ubiquinone biosynthesis monooxygenase COQ6 [Chloropicon primus]